MPKTLQENKERFIVYIQFYIEDDDILKAEEQANKIVSTWDKRPDEIQVQTTVRGVSS